MSETVDCLNRDFPGFFILSAVAHHFDRAGISEKFGREVQVTMTVNGHDLPFHEVMTDIWKRAEAEIDRRVSERAYALVSAAGLEPLRDAFERVQHHLKEAIVKAGGQWVED